ncbi:MAG: segregation/condensation protein A [Clostridia bacterium]|nr:segregation/condensation protein A [Clostridia bacterium]MDY2714083.1 segregation/condensation protein A [Christensenellaceae bacterium]
MTEEINATETESELTEYSKKAQNFESVVDYTTKISNFEGPLDLLLFLVNRAEIEIKDIFVSEVTEQFLDYVNRADDMDMEKESEYLAIAATLLEIKSKALLPQTEFDFDDSMEDDYYDPKQSLIQQIEEYKLFKEASQKLKDIETTDRFYKEPDESAKDVRIVYKDFNLNGLVKAFTDLLARSDLENRIKNEQKEIPKDSFTVADKIDFIKHTMLERESCSFFDLFGKYSSKPEIITTFQALLELLKLQYLTVEQGGTYDDITITIREDRNDEVGDLSEYN